MAMAMGSSGSTLALFVCFTWCLFNVATSQLQSFQSQVLLQLKKHLEYPKQLEMWYDHGTDFCSLPPTPQMNITCNFNSVTELKITGDKPSDHHATFHGFALPNKTLSKTFSIDSFITTLTRLSSLKSLSLVCLGIWGPLPDKIHRLSSSLEYLDLNSNFLFGSIPPKISTFLKLQVLVLDDNFFNGTEFGFLASLSNLSTLSLKNNCFSGDVSSQLIDLNRIFSMPNISYLNLASNKLTGSFPENLSCNSILNFIDISDNKLTGGLPSCFRAEAGIRIAKFDGNCLSVDHKSQHDVSYCKVGDHMNVEITESEGKGKGKGKGKSLGIVIGIAGVVMFLAIGFLLVYRRCRLGAISEQILLHKTVQGNSASGFSSEFLSNARFMSETPKIGSQLLPAARSFTLEELKEATNNFDSSYILAEGSYGKLYKGKLESGMPVAIRCLPSSKRYSIRNLRLRLDMLAKIRHPNLVGVIGHCIDSVSQEDHYSVNRVFIVYEYISNGNLRAYFEDNASGETLKWSERLAALTGVAKAVHFLHTGVIPGFFNNRLKTNNILLNEHKMAKLSDYGLSIIPEQSVNHGGEDNKSWQMKRLEDDVYSFGLILLESIVGSSMASKTEGFLRQALASLGNQEGQGRMISPIVMATSSQESLSIIISITCKCISLESWSRPTFEDILWNLQSAAQAQEKADGAKRR